MSRAWLYRQFPDKASLVLATLARTDRQFWTEAHARVSAATGLPAQVAEAVALAREQQPGALLLELKAREPEAFADVMGTGLREMMPGMATFWHAYLEEARARRRGPPRPRRRPGRRVGDADGPVAGHGARARGRGRRPRLGAAVRWTSSWSPASADRGAGPSRADAGPATLPPVCLLVFAWQTEPDYPLVVAANRDERLDRPAHTLCVLQEERPRILGGRDELAGGTWLAVNQHGVVAGLTNRPAPGGRDPTMRSRGRAPPAAGRPDNRRRRGGPPVGRGGARPVQPGMAPGGRPPLPLVRRAGRRSGPDGPSPAPRCPRPGERRHRGAVTEGRPGPRPGLRGPYRARPRCGRRCRRYWPTTSCRPGPPRPPSTTTTVPRGRAATLAACVHTEDYGTRSAALLRVPASVDRRPEMLVADGPPCTAPFVDVSHRWRG